MKPDFKKFSDGLVPAIIQDESTNAVLMLGYMDEAAYEQTLATRKVVFFSRTRQRLWMKGETSGNVLSVSEMLPDCDNDCILIKAIPAGPVCHTGADTCFGEINGNADTFLRQLEGIIAERKAHPVKDSYTSRLFEKGINAMAQKVGEEAVELIIEAKDNDAQRFKEEAADLLFHYLVLLNAKGARLDDIIRVLMKRHAKQ